MAKNKPEAALVVVEGKTADVGRFELPAEVSAFAGGLGIDLTGTLDERANLAAEHMNRSQRHMLASGLLLASIKAECEHGQFTELIAARGFEERAARKAMQYAEFVCSQPEATRLRLIEMPRSKVMEIASADPEVIQALLEDGGDQADALSVRGLRERIRELEAATTDLQVQRDTAEAEAAGLKKRLDRGLPDRSDQVPQVIADLRAEILALGKKAALAVDSFTPLGVELVTMSGHETGHPWADATLRLAVTQLQALEVQLHGLVHKYRTAFRDGDAAPVPTSYLTQQEMNEAAAMFDQLTQAHGYEARLREWEREQAKPKGKGRPKAKPLPPGAAA